MTDPRPITDRLKQDTQSLHDAAEEGGFNKALMGGQLPREGYVALLGQLLAVHTALEGLIRQHVESAPALKAVVTEEQYQVPYLLEDLAYFGVDPASIAPLPATRDLITQITEAAKSDPASLTGFHYVLEGSNNGGRVIAMRVREAYELPTDKGTRYLDPYGPAQRGKWKTWKENLAACELTEDEQTAMVDAAGQMFRAIARVHDELYVTCAPTRA